MIFEFILTFFILVSFKPKICDANIFGYARTSSKYNVKERILKDCTIKIYEQ